MEKCLDDTTRMLQNEIDKCLAGKSNSDGGAKTSTKPEPTSAPPTSNTALDDDDDPDAMVAAFYAKQQAAKEKAEKLPVEDWAPLIIARNKTRRQAEQKGGNDSTSDTHSETKQLVDSLWQTFSVVQES